MISEQTAHYLFDRFSRDLACAAKNAGSSFAYRQERWARMDLMNRILEMTDAEILAYDWNGGDING
ncbi:hypothetical protein FACS1894216_01310 [Synergistales bacterium]|nr:hypothetical protein FACS1894216_01310 [Synergistales bacterium]